ncbi:xanthine dehydrogenase family protein molybdopterin-binding subunit [Caldinitratiruptor microaerophilus]|uniref:Aldehyde dehydrogenase n=1 Tax=Caldinitratiruptor microaerophilus TaxID=671077 RepID=A0AA35CNV4_9FIRM|nr:xanthine dehydrogenase family protein molybdopterin-binding subunit [Caldinitratiruptor microaerophilus]BDG60790.1 aldehyde dehydrogenase [Caldinitratiruptor microaerophilus]
MSTRYFGQPIRRNEDLRLLTGRGVYVDDISRPDMLHAAVVRSPYAHARIRRIDVARARQMPGVVAVYMADDLGPLNGPLPLLIPHDDLVHGRTQSALVKDKVRHLGEAVAFVVAQDRYLAEDAAEAVEVDYEPLPAVHDLLQALDPAAPRVHDDMPDNVAARIVRNVGDYDAARARADLVLTERLRIDRGTAASMETRGIVAIPEGDGYTMYVSTQAPVALRNGLAGWFGLPQMKLRVIAPDVGGGFGPKVMMFYPEEVLVLFAAMKLRRPVKWIEDRRENFVATTQEREQVHEVEVAVSRDGTLLGLYTRFVHDSGAYTPYGIQVPIITLTTLPGPYRLRNYRVEGTVVYTNKPTVTPYRGAGRPHGVFVMERMMDRIAEALGMDPLAVRRKNFIQPDEFPWDTGLIYQDWAPTRYDSGNYPLLADTLVRLLDLDRVRREQEEARRQGRYVGVGMAFYVEGSGPGPYEGVRVQVEPSGKVLVATGVGTQGQGHFTSFAQVVADQLGVRVEDVHVVTGDTAAMGWGIGTFASRAAVVVGNAAHLAAQAVADKARQVAARLLECSPDDIELADGRARVKGAPARSLSLGEVAFRANPLRGTLQFGEPGLEATRYFSPQQSTFPSGGHAAVVEVDPETAQIRVLRYCVVHDCGTVINPMIVEGQIHGGVAQGIGGVFYEKLVFDENAQLLTSTFMDYLLPTASEVPHIETDHIETPSPLNPLGIKGAGEAGVIPVAAVFAQALEDALRPFGVRVTEMPLSPARLWDMIRKGGGTPPAAGEEVGNETSPREGRQT